MSTDRVNIVQRNLDEYLAAARPAPRLLAPEDPVVPGSTLTVRRALSLFEDQLLSRAVDVEARRLKARGESFYTISSAGHEQNAVLGALLRTTDPCFLHYRSGGLMMARGRQDPGTDMVRDTMLSVCASDEDPTAEGRHKVWGSRRLWVPPQTSTIASHLPKAVGLAFALARARRMGVDPGLPADSVVCCSFGDASANHASALTAIGAARYGSRRGNPMPILFVCEDNGIGISTETPRRWIHNSFSRLTYLRYLEAAGDVDRVWATVEEAVHLCRSTRAPVFLRLETVRLWGHAGSDIETAYRTPAEIEAAEARDPLLVNARRLLELGAATPDQLKELVATTRERVRRDGEWAATRGHLDSAERVMASLAPYDAERVRTSATSTTDADGRRAFWGNELPEDATSPVKRTMASHLSAALADEMRRRREIVVFGEDVGRKGGVYYVTAGLQKRHGSSRVIDTHLDETSILGLAQGAGMAGLLPIPEIQYLAYVHNAVDQLRGEASSLQFFSAGQFSNPMVVRIASFAYQKGFGGHFHNDHAIGGLRDIPGLVLASPSRGDDAVRMLRGCVAMARECGRVVCFLEPIALYHEKDLHAEGDGAWLFDYPAPGEALLPGEVGVYPAAVPDSGPELLLLSYANGLRMSLQAQRILQVDYGIPVRVVDLRWLNPLPFEALRSEAASAAGVLVVDECRATGGGIAEAVVAHLAESDYAGPVRSIRAPDTFVPLGPAANAVLIQTPDIVRAAVKLAERVGRAGPSVPTLVR
ncbi:MAG TPA: thiamine pyrophosphate-dependent enzyme [Longimicrobiales bacterium]|nr:thiamine pyrophosphate-dependent enzyme [Longimicrobiales bacterium]